MYIQFHLLILVKVINCIFTDEKPSWFIQLISVCSGASVNVVLFCEYVFCNFFSEDYICTCLQTKWFPLVLFLGLSSLFQWLGSLLKCQRMMQILANYEKGPTDHRAGQTGLAGGKWNYVHASVIPQTAGRSQFWLVRLDTDHLILYFLLTLHQPLCSLSPSSILLLCCKCSCIFSFFSNPFCNIFFNSSTK